MVLNHSVELWCQHQHKRGKRFFPRPFKYLIFAQAWVIFFSQVDIKVCLLNFNRKYLQTADINTRQVRGYYYFHSTLSACGRKLFTISNVPHFKHYSRFNGNFISSYFFSLSILLFFSNLLLRFLSHKLRKKFQTVNEASSYIVEKNNKTLKTLTLKIA